MRAEQSAEQFGGHQITMSTPDLPSLPTHPAGAADVRAPELRSGDGLGAPQDGLTIHLVLTRQWYDLTAAGEKLIEYREMTPRWMRLIYERRDQITHVRFSRAYSKETITRRVHEIDVGPCPIPGWSGQYFRIHFSPNGSHEPRGEQAPK
jgi:hypothetical protein